MANDNEPRNLLWQVDEIIIALQRLRERLRRLAANEGAASRRRSEPSPKKPRP